MSCHFFRLLDFLRGPSPKASTAIKCSERDGSIQALLSTAVNKILEYRKSAFSSSRGESLTDGRLGINDRLQTFSSFQRKFSASLHSGTMHFVLSVVGLLTETYLVNSPHPMSISCTIHELRVKLH